MEEETLYGGSDPHEIGLNRLRTRPEPHQPDTYHPLLNCLVVKPSAETATNNKMDDPSGGARPQRGHPPKAERTARSYEID
ncbi:unnamed protein product [Zymoseptoria tritici ST99CH_3D1]|nr:unnamed protein product [Zymoseptoria tritici ST99CH_3D1]